MPRTPEMPMEPEWVKTEAGKEIKAETEAREPVFVQESPNEELEERKKEAEIRDEVAAGVALNVAQEIADRNEEATATEVPGEVDDRSKLKRAGDWVADSKGGRAAKWTWKTKPVRAGRWTASMGARVSGLFTGKLLSTAWYGATRGPAIVLSAGLRKIEELGMKFLPSFLQYKPKETYFESELEKYRETKKKNKKE